MNEHNEVVTSNRVEMGHASAKQLLWTQLGQCESTEMGSAVDVTGLFLKLQPHHEDLTTPGIRQISHTTGRCSDTISSRYHRMVRSAAR